jgi:hypothetical protein
VGWIVGGVGLATGATLFFTSPSSAPSATGKTEPKAQAALQFFGSGAAVSYSGTF